MSNKLNVTERFNYKLTPSDKRALRALSRYYDVTMGEVLRWLVQKDARRVIRQRAADGWAELAAEKATEQSLRSLETAVD